MQDPPLLAVFTCVSRPFLGEGWLAPGAVTELVGVPGVLRAVVGLAKAHWDLMDGTDDDGFFFIFLAFLWSGFYFRLVLLSVPVFRMRFIRMRFIRIRFFYTRWGGPA